MAEKSDQGLRWLIAGTCAVIIATAGYFFFGEYQDHRAKQEAKRQAVLEEVQKWLPKD